MLTQNDRDAFRRAKAALDACRSILETCKVSVTTDYTIGVAIGRVEDAQAEVRHGELCSDPDQ